MFYNICDRDTFEIKIEEDDICITDILSEKLFFIFYIYFFSVNYSYGIRNCVVQKLCHQF